MRGGPPPVLKRPPEDDLDEESDGLAPKAGQSLEVGELDKDSKKSVQELVAGLENLDVGVVNSTSE